MGGDKEKEKDKDKDIEKEETKVDENTEKVENKDETKEEKTEAEDKTKETKKLTDFNFNPLASEFQPKVVAPAAVPAVIEPAAQATFDPTTALAMPPAMYYNPFVHTPF